MAAVAVTLAHLEQDGIPIGWAVISRYSHEAVIIFFVLSGFIINNNTLKTSPTVMEYTVARISRIWSVAIPAVAFSILLSLLLLIFSSNALPSNYREFSWIDLGSSLLFLNESWSNSARLTLNNPYWSLCYEVWFYAIFAAYFFNRSRSRWWLVTALALIAGPAIVALLPVWAFGALTVFQWRKGYRLPQRLAWVLFLLAPIAMTLFNIFDLDVVVRELVRKLIPFLWRLGNSQRFVTDYILGFLICLNIFSFDSLPKSFKSFFSCRQKLFSYLAGFSFTLYLFHRPLTQISGTYLKEMEVSVFSSAAVALVIFFTCWAISFLTERQLPRWKRIITLIICGKNPGKLSAFSDAENR